MQLTTWSELLVSVCVCVQLMCQMRQNKRKCAVNYSYGDGEKKGSVCIGCLPPECVWHLLNLLSHLVNNCVVCVFSVNMFESTLGSTWILNSHRGSFFTLFDVLCEKPHACILHDYVNMCGIKSGMQQTESEFLISASARSIWSLIFKVTNRN